MSVRLVESQRLRRGHDFYPPAVLRAAVPPLYGTEDTPAADKVAHLHYFIGAADWWLVEADWTTGNAFGFCDLGHGGEWGYVYLPELESVAAGPLGDVVERDLHWSPVPFGQIAR
ncbi:DUF2958 domain-containing protein [Isoptericola jiangsuensis]|uniref:DUF2958 domain-containing protein n=1 Tax=Isoptericola jiangsuensis TaxID=548579 RepID=UPI003AAD8E6F